MSFGELIFRTRRSALTLIEPMYVARRQLPKPCLSLLPVFPVEIPEIEDDALVKKAIRIVNGHIDIFAMRNFCLGVVPQWNRDPKTGVLTRQKFGKRLDYRDESQVGNIKYLWEPSRHLMLPVLAQAFRITGHKRFVNRIVQLLDSWFDQCRFPNGPHWSSALEAAIRIINWSVTWRLIGCLEGWRSAGAMDAFLARWMESICQHLHFIDSYYSGYSSANNHLIGEAAGVYIGATTWPAWTTSGPLRQRARAILIEQATIQTHPDGVNAEQAVAYQQFVLDFLLLAGLLSNAAGDPFPKPYWQNIERMLEFLAAIMDLKGNVPMFGDSDDGFVLDLTAAENFSNFSSLLATGAILFNRKDFAKKVDKMDDKTRWLIPDAAARLASLQSRVGKTPDTIRAFPFGGYFVLGSDLDTDREVRIVVDAGPLGFGTLAAHGHADALSFTLSVSGVPFIIDPGTYSYHTEKHWRNYFRGSSAHNTVRVDRVDQSEIGGNFLWNKHATVTVHRHEITTDTQFIDASHDGYARLSDSVVHRRTFNYDSRNKVLTIQDRFDCHGCHEVEQFLHFAEYVEVSEHGETISAKALGRLIRISLDSNTSLQLIVGNEQLPLGWVSYGFDNKSPTTTLKAHTVIHGTTVLEIKVSIL